jgi:hypothetical protein
MALAVAKSGLFGIKTPDQALSLMLIAQAEGLHPAIAARDYHVIQGRPTLKADAMLARFQSAGGKVEWHDLTDAEVSGTFSHPAGGSARINWTMDMAKKANLTGKEVWKQYPRAMLRARVVSEGIRTVFPGVVVGVYTPEETEQFAAEPTPIRSRPARKDEVSEVAQIALPPAEPPAAPPAPALMDPSRIADWIAAIEAASDDEFEAITKEALGLATEVKDADAFRAFRQAARKRAA